MGKKEIIGTALEYVHQRMEAIRVEHLKHVIVLKGYNNAGKTSVLKLLIEELYRRNPQGCAEQSSFNPIRVDVTNTREYHAVFNYRGGRIEIRTAGDTKDIIVKTFECFDKHQVEIGITAVRVHQEGKADVVAEHVYAEIDSIRQFRSHEISIVGRKLRTRETEMAVVEEIIAVLDEIIIASNNRKEQGR